MWILTDSPLIDGYSRASLEFELCDVVRDFAKVSACAIVLTWCNGCTRADCDRIVGAASSYCQSKGMAAVEVRKRQ